MSEEPNYILAFLEHRGLDYQHRTLRKVWAFSDYEIERTHDFIQWVFPTTEPSQNVIGSPVLSSDELALVRASKEAKESIIASSDWFMGFLSRQSNWTRGYDHNHLRITRMLHSLVQIGAKEIALDVFSGAMTAVSEFQDREPIQKAIAFWSREVR